MTHRLRNFLLVATFTLPIFFAKGGTFGTGGEEYPKRSGRNVFYHVDRVSVAFGGGYNYAGIGGSFMIYAEEQLGVFVSGGHNFMGDTNYAFGLKFRKITHNRARIQPYLTAMYGFHGSIAVGGNHSLSRNYHGATVGVGIDQKYQKEALGYFTAGVLMAFRGKTYQDHLDFLDENSFARSSMVSPVMVTIGYHFVIH